LKYLDPEKKEEKKKMLKKISYKEIGPCRDSIPVPSTPQSHTEPLRYWGILVKAMQ
jgi:hypothetical protein